MINNKIPLVLVWHIGVSPFLCHFILVHCLLFAQKLLFFELSKLTIQNICCLDLSEVHYRDLFPIHLIGQTRARWQLSKIKVRGLYSMYFYETITTTTCSNSEYTIFLSALRFAKRSCIFAKTLLRILLQMFWSGIVIGFLKLFSLAQKSAM